MPIATETETKTGFGIAIVTPLGLSPQDYFKSAEDAIAAVPRYKAQQKQTRPNAFFEYVAFEWSRVTTMTPLEAQ